MKVIATFINFILYNINSGLVKALKKLFDISSSKTR